MGLKDTIKAVKQDLPITMRHETWVTENPDPVYSQKALDFAAKQLAGKSGSQRLRKRMFRASSAGTCHRKQVFGYLGMPGRKEVDSKLANIFSTGNMMHLKWQLAGLSEGWLTDAEVPVDRDDLRAGGTMDGVTYTGGGFEFKSINSRGYNGVHLYGPKDLHLYQTDHYMYLGDLESFSIIYENKDTGDWREFLHHRDEDRMERVAASLETLGAHVDNKKLPPVLAECKSGTGTTFRQCQFKDICLKTKGWPA